MKRQTVIILGSAGLTVVMPLTQSCHCNTKATKGEWMMMCSKQRYFQMYMKSQISDVGEGPDLVVAVFCLFFSRTVNKMSYWAS